MRAKHKTAGVTKLVVTGPESSGKTTLAEGLSVAWGAGCAEEVARAYLGAMGGPYQESDLLAIAQAQLALEDRLASGQGTGRIVCDTDLITIRIWSEEKYGRCDPWIAEQTEQRDYDHWLLCSPEGITWEPDPLRENPEDRERLFQRHIATLDRLGKPYTVLVGDRQGRLEHALAIARKVEQDRNR